MRENLPISLRLAFGDEGGYSNRSTDAGGPTKFGITAKTLAAHRGMKSVTAAQVKALKLPEAQSIYEASYWSQAGGDVFPAGLDYAAFDYGVNSGPVRAIKTLQEVLKRKAGYTGKVDGWVGPGTLGAIKNYPAGDHDLIRDYCDARMAFLRSLKGKTGFPSNGRGWTIRVTGVDPKGEWKTVPGVVGNALAMAGKESGTVNGKVRAPVPAIKAAPDPLPAGGDSKAVPKDNVLTPYLKPDVLLPAAAGAATAGGGGWMAILGNDWVIAAIAFAIVVAVLLGAYYAFRRIKATT